MSSNFNSGRLHYKGYSRGEARPALGFSVELLLALGGQAIKLGAAIVFGSSPFGFEEATKLEAMECWIERAFFYFEELLGGLVNPLGDGVAVLRAPDERLEDEHLERALDEIAGVGVFFPKHLMGKVPETARRCQQCTKCFYGMGAGADVPLNGIDRIGPFEVVPCYKAK